MRNATSMESSGSPADLQDARQGCLELGRQAEGIAELVVPLLRQATQELARLETQREELRKTAAREAQQTVLPKLTERIEEQGQHTRRLERASRGLKELISGLGSLGERLQSGLSRHAEEQRELEAIAREEKRMWLQELNSLREQVSGQQATSSSPSPAQQEELQRLRAENETHPKLRAERERLAHRVAELEKGLAEREQTLAAKEQTIEDLRRMIVLLTGDAAPPKAESKPLPPPSVSVVPLAPKAPPPKPKPAESRTPDQMFGNSTMQLATSMLESLGEPPPASVPPVDRAPPAPPSPRVPSMEIMLEPLDDLEAPRPALPPPVPIAPPVPDLPAVQQTPLMRRASARLPSGAPTKTPAPVPGLTPQVHGRPGILVISEDMFNDVLVEQKPSGGSGKK